MKKYIAEKTFNVLVSLKGQLVFFGETSIFSVIISPIVWLITNALGYINLVVAYDHQLLAFSFMLIFLDSFFGILKWVKLSKLSEKKFIIGIIEKSIISIAAIMIANMAILSISPEEHPNINSYVKLLGKIIIFMYPAASIGRNMFFITNGKFPPIGIMRKLDSFENNASLDDIFNTEKQKAE